MDKRTHRYQQKKLQSLLRQLRKKAGLRQVELAEIIDRPQSFISKYETGERRLDLVELKIICESVGTSLQELVNQFENEI